MRIIFLDIDGVLNVIPETFDRFGGIFHQNFVDNLRMLIKRTGAKIVISSSWRKNGLDKMKQMWKERNLPGEVIDCTPSLYLQKGGGIQFWNDKLNQHPTPKVKGYSIPRGAEIEYWIKNESKRFGEIESYVILDDDTDMLFSQKNNFVQCSNNQQHSDCIDIGYGLTRMCMYDAIFILLRKEFFMQWHFNGPISLQYPDIKGIGYEWDLNENLTVIVQTKWRTNHGVKLEMNYETEV